MQQLLWMIPWLNLLALLNNEPCKERAAACRQVVIQLHQQVLANLTPAGRGSVCSGAPPMILLLILYTPFCRCAAGSAFVRRSRASDKPLHVHTLMAAA